MKRRERVGCARWPVRNKIFDFYVLAKGLAVCDAKGAVAAGVEEKGFALLAARRFREAENEMHTSKRIWVVGRERIGRSRSGESASGNGLHRSAGHEGISERSGKRHLHTTSWCSKLRSRISSPHIVSNSLIINVHRAARHDRGGLSSHGWASGHKGVGSGREGRSRCYAGKRVGSIEIERSRSSVMRVRAWQRYKVST